VYFVFFFPIFPLCGILETLLANHILTIRKEDETTGEVKEHLC
jgi:hypothetical protein